MASCGVFSISSISNDLNGSSKKAIQCGRIKLKGYTLFRLGLERGVEN